MRSQVKLLNYTNKFKDYRAKLIKNKEKMPKFMDIMRNL